MASEETEVPIASDETATVETQSAQDRGVVRLPATWARRSALCRVLGGGLQLEGECHCLLRGDMLLLGRQPGKAEDMRLLSGASIATRDAVVDISPPEWLSRTLSLGFSSADEAALWAKELRSAALLWEESKALVGGGPQRVVNPRRQGNGESTPCGQEESIIRSHCSKGGELDKTVDEASHGCIEDWLEAQIEQSSHLLALFQEQELWLSQTADCLAHRRESEFEKSEALEVLEREEVIQQSTISHLQAKVASLALQAKDAETLEEQPPPPPRPRERGWRLQDLARNAASGHPGLLLVEAEERGRMAGRAAAGGASMRTRSVPNLPNGSTSRQRAGTMRTPPVPGPGAKVNAAQHAPKSGEEARFTGAVSTPPFPSKSQPARMSWNLRKLQYNLSRGGAGSRRRF